MRKFSINIATRAGLISLALVIAACAADPAAPVVQDQCEIQIEEPVIGYVKEVFVPMRDCVQLATNISVPDGEGPFPVILVRSPYGKGGGSALGGLGVEQIFLPAGYAVVSQDVRGRFNSGGDFVPFVNEREDGADTLKWLEQQPWFNGKVGAWGASYLGATAMLAAIERPDLVQAVVAAVITSEIYSVAYEHGLMRADIGGSWALIMYEQDQLHLPTTAQQRKAMLQFPLREADKRTVGEVAFDDPFFDNDTNNEFYLSQLKPNEWKDLATPTYMITGWFDFMSRGQLSDYRAMVADKKEHLFMHIGAWNHLMGLQPTHDYDFPNYGSLPFVFSDMVVFLDHYLKGNGRPELQEDRQPAPLSPVVYYDGGEGVWHSSDKLFTTSQTLSFYASNITASASCERSGELVASQPTSTTVGDWAYDPTDYPEVPGALVLDLNDKAGMQQDLDWCSRSDAVVLTTPAFDTKREVMGDIDAHLVVRSDAADSPVYTRLSLIDIDGQAYNLREGAMLLSYRNGDEAQKPYTPNQWVRVSIPMHDLRWTLQPGQKLQLAVSGGAFPFVAPHPNVAGDWKNARNPKIANLQILAGPLPAGDSSEPNVGVTRLDIAVRK